MRALFDHVHIRFRTVCFELCLLDVTSIGYQDNGLTFVGHGQDDAGTACETSQPSNVLARCHDEPGNGDTQIPANQTLNEPTVVGRVVEWCESLEA